MNTKQSNTYHNERLRGHICHKEWSQGHLIQGNPREFPPPRCIDFPKDMIYVEVRLCKFGREGLDAELF